MRDAPLRAAAPRASARSDGFRVGYEGRPGLGPRAAHHRARVTPTHIRHIPHVLYHWRAVAGSTALAIGEKRYATAAQQRTLATHFERAARGGRPALGRGALLARPLSAAAPGPARDGGHPDARPARRCLRRCDREPPRANGLSEPARSSWSTTAAPIRRRSRTWRSSRATPDVRIVRYDAPFNFSALNNLGRGTPAATSWRC